jgi:uncharacterized protein
MQGDDSVGSRAAREVISDIDGGHRGVAPNRGPSRIYRLDRDAGSSIMAPRRTRVAAIIDWRGASAVDRLQVGEDMGTLKSIAAVLLALVVAFLAAFATATSAGAQADYPELKGHIVDEAAMLGDAMRTALTRRLDDLERKTATHVVVVTLASLRNSTIEAFSTALARQGGFAGSGQKAVMVTVGPHDGRLAVQFTPDLSAALSNAVTDRIFANAKVYLQAHNYPAAITRVVDDIATVMTGTTPTEIGSIAFAAKHPAPRTAAGFPAMIGWVMDEADAVDDTTRWVLGGELETFEAKHRALVVVAVVPTPRIALGDYAGALARNWNLGELYQGRNALLVIAPKAAAAYIDVGSGLKDVLTADLTKRILDDRVLPHLQAGDTTRAATRGSYAITEVLSVGAADLTAQGPDHGSWLEANRERGFSYFIGTLITILVLGAVISLATLAGWLPAKRKGMWRALDWIVAIAGSISVSSGDSSSRSSSRPYSGGGGSSGGGGASGSW